VGLNCIPFAISSRKILQAPSAQSPRWAIKWSSSTRPYFSWTPDQTKDMRKLLDDLGIRCNSTHNDSKALAADGLTKAIELNQILGSKTIVLASPGRVTSADGWKEVPARLSSAQESLRRSACGPDITTISPSSSPMDGGKRPIEIIAENTPKGVMLQLDIGTAWRPDPILSRGSMPIQDASIVSLQGVGSR